MSPEPRNADSENPGSGPVGPGAPACRRKLPLSHVRLSVEDRAKAIDRLKYLVTSDDFGRAYESATDAEAVRIEDLIAAEPFAEATRTELKTWIDRRTPKPPATFRTMGVRELREEAARCGIKVRGRNKDELIAALERRAADG